MGPALTLCVLWVVATYLLEGRPRTLLRPDAVGLRLAYTLVANVVIATLGAVLVLRWLIATGVTSASSAGFGTWRRSLLSVVFGLLAGGGACAARACRSTRPRWSCC